MRKLSTLLFFLFIIFKASADPCSAAFTFSVDGYTINLDGSSSTGDVAQWAWYLNGDLFSDAGPQTHVIADTGTYEICLVITTASQCIDTICQEVTVEQSQDNCETCFTFSVDGFTINLDGSCTAGDVVHWMWYIDGDLFSDGGPETHHIVSDTGMYTICLIISTSSGCVDTFCHEVHVEQQQGDCEACFTFSVDGFTINLDGSCSTGDVVHWMWYIDGDLFSDGGPETHHIVSDTGMYTICLIISTSSGCVDTFCHEVHVEQQQGDCEACFSYSVDGFTINLDGSCTAGDVVHWMWYIDGDLFSDGGPETHHIVSDTGMYTICLIISTSSGCVDTFCHEVHVEQQQGDCEACFTYSVDGFTINLDGSCTTADVVHWMWYINGDLFSDGGPETHHIVSDTGTYTICLIISTSSGCVDTFCHEVHVEQPQGDCEACFTFSVDGFTIHLDGSCSTGDVVHWQWYINGDLFSDAGPETQHTVIEEGTYVICLITTTASGCIDTACQEVHVEQQQGDCEACFTYWLDGFTINLNGSCSTGDVVHWQWYINGDLFSDAGPETQNTVIEEGTYVICLITTTASGCIDTACHEVHVEQQQGDCESCFAYSVDGFTINLDGSCSTGDVVHWQWYINGDLFSDDGPETQHTVIEEGTYVICLITTTASGCIDTACQEVHVEQQQGDCEACFTYWLDGFTIHLNGSCSTGDVVHWQWYINGDLFSDDGPETHHEVTDSGEYEICLIIETASGCTDTFCDHITVEDFQNDDYEFKVMPPNSDGNLSIQLYSPEQGFFSIYIFDIIGRNIFEQKNDLPSGISQFTVLTDEQLSPTCYFVIVNFNGEITRSSKVMILK